MHDSIDKLAGVVTVLAAIGLMTLIAMSAIDEEGYYNEDARPSAACDGFEPAVGQLPRH